MTLGVSLQALEKSLNDLRYEPLGLRKESPDLRKESPISMTLGMISRP